MSQPQKHIIMIDNFDSFTFNLVDYFKQAGARLTVYRNTAAISTIEKLRPDLLVYSPGPGNPQQAGNLLKYIQHFAERVPQFGVCLGMQAMVEAFGGSLRVLAQPVHGKSSQVTHDGKTIFSGIASPMEVGRYHSLAAKRMPECLVVSATTIDRRGDAQEDEVVMAVRHTSLPIEGVQFHPESILSFKHNAGLQMIQNVLQYL